MKNDAKGQKKKTKKWLKRDRRTEKRLPQSGIPVQIPSLSPKSCFNHKFMLISLKGGNMSVLFLLPSNGQTYSSCSFNGHSLMFVNVILMNVIMFVWNTSSQLCMCQRRKSFTYKTHKAFGCIIIMYLVLGPELSALATHANKQNKKQRKKTSSKTQVQIFEKIFLGIIFFKESEL